MASTQRSEARDKWKPIVAKWKRSGLTRTEFAKRNGLSVHALGWWIREIKPEYSRPRTTRVRKKQAPAFVEVGEFEDSSKAEPLSAVFEIAFGKGFVLRVPKEFSKEALVGIINALQGV